MNTPTLYLMSKYTGREADCLKENQDAWLVLNAKGYLVYSPICESHNIEEYRSSYASWQCPNCKIQGGLNFEGANRNKFSPLTKCIKCNYMADYHEFMKTIPEPDYVARDLRFIEKLSDKNGFMDHTFKCNRCDETIMWNWAKGYGGCKCGKRYHHRWTEQLYTKIPCPEYDSGVVGVVLPSAYHYPNSTSTYNIELGFIWDSKGAQKEYQYMKSKHILIITLETALTVPPEQWGECSL